MKFVFYFHQTFYSCIRNVGWLMLIREIIVVCSEIIRNTNTLFDRNEKSLMLQKVVHIITIRCQRSDDVSSVAFVISR